MPQEHMPRNHVLTLETSGGEAISQGTYFCRYILISSILQ